ncbi:MAG: glycosyltransferase family 2 protein [Phycisphaerales bacterium]
MPSVRLAVVILNYRTPGLVTDCLVSLDGQLEPGRDEAIVVDNASGDGSADEIERSILERGFGGWARLVRSRENGGFSAGNNVGLRAVEAEAYLLLNSDTIVRPGAVAELLAALGANPSAGLIGPRLEWPDGTPQVSCFNDHTVLGQVVVAAQSGPITAALRRFDLSRGVPEAPAEGAWVSFAAVLIPRKTLDEIGYMDEGFFMYFEDAEFGRRVRAAGLGVVYWPAARVVHLRGGTSPVKEAQRARRRVPEYFYRARSRYFALRGGRATLLAANLAWTVGWLVAVLRRVVQRRPIGTPKHAARDIWLGFSRPLEPFRPGGKGSA